MGNWLRNRPTRRILIAVVILGIPTVLYCVYRLLDPSFWT